MLEQRTTRHQSLLDFVSCELYVEIVGESPDDFVQPEIDRPQRGKAGGRVDLVTEPLESLERIDVFDAHADYRTPAGVSLCSRTSLVAVSIQADSDV